MVIDILHELDAGDETDFATSDKLNESTLAIGDLKIVLASRLRNE
jgi:hypothetical protein